MRRKEWLVKGVLLGASVIVLGSSVSLPLRRVARERRLEQTKRDFKEIFIGTAGYGIDRCGVNYPPDTGVRRRETPEWPLTFEIDGVYYKERAFAGLNLRDKITPSSSLTTPVAYMKALPSDPFRSDGGFYGYFTCEAGPGRIRPMAVLRSVGPDGREDLPMAEMKEAVERRLKMEPTRSLMSMGQPETRGWVRAMVDPYLYDPTNGAASRGDLIMVMDRCNYRYGWGGSDGLWASVKPARVSGDFKSDKPLPEWDLEQPLPKPKDYAQQLWTDARFRMPVELLDALERAGIMVEQGEFYAMEGTEKKPFEERLNRLRNHFGPFREFFQKPAALTAEQREALKRWRAEDPAWWSAVEDAKAFGASNKTEPARLSDFLDLVVLYGKSKTLLAAELTAEEDPRQAYHQLMTMDLLLQSFYRSVEPVGGNPASTNPAYGHPFFSRVHEELGRLVREERAIVARAIAEQAPPQPRAGE